ncbi:MAG TPA: histidine kinase [Lacunisphaera sp.]|nr:histidine kinase [Lacunisphaera sp.]
MPAQSQVRCTFLLLGLLFVPGAATIAAEPAPLTSAAAVLSLSAAQAGMRLPVVVTGVVTASESDWNGQFFIQDATGGVFVENLGRPGPAPGDVVTIDGVTHPGAFAPIISSPQWRVVGRAPLPEPKRVLIENLEAGAEDGLRVEISGVVRTARVENARLVADLAVGGYRLQVNAHLAPDVPVASLIAARVRVRGTAATHYNESLRHLTSVGVYAPQVEDFTVLEPERVSPFDEEVIPVNNVAQYQRGRAPERRVHLRGTVTLQRYGEEVFLQDATGGIRLACAATEHFSPGDPVEAAGFIEYEDYLPLLRDAELRRRPGPQAPLAARSVPFAELKRGLHHGELIRLRGKLLNRSTRPVSRPTVAFNGFTTVLLLQGDDTTFTVEFEGGQEDTVLAAVPVGSVVEVDGVGVLTVDATGKQLLSLRLLLPEAAGLRVLQRPSWLTPERLLAGVALLSVGLIILGAWLLTVASKNAALKNLIREREQAQRALQEAHDTLEQKVAERSAQLQVEMTARKTDELQFKAVLAERTRLARDLHDTLEQTLTGIALRLDTSARVAARDPAAADRHLQLARNWLHQSQVDLRRSIWDLRSRELEQFDLAGALRRSAEQLVDGTDIRLNFQTEGAPQGLPEIVEENVLRIGQEALTNIAKHARASRVGILLQFTPAALLLRIEDNGVGFAHSDADLPAEGHFGLRGMTERTKRIAGGITINSSPGKGTIITVEIPLETGGTTP